MSILYGDLGRVLLVRLDGCCPVALSEGVLAEVLPDHVQALHLGLVNKRVLLIRLQNQNKAKSE